MRPPIKKNYIIENVLVILGYLDSCIETYEHQEGYRSIMFSTRRALAQYTHDKISRYITTTTRNIENIIKEMENSQDINQKIYFDTSNNCYRKQKDLNNFLLPSASPINFDAETLFSRIIIDKGIIQCDSCGDAIQLSYFLNSEFGIDDIFTISYNTQILCAMTRKFFRNKKRVSIRTRINEKLSYYKRKEICGSFPTPKIRNIKIQEKFDNNTKRFTDGFTNDMLNELNKKLSQIPIPSRKD